MIINLLRTKKACGVLILLIASVSKMVALPVGFNSGHYYSATQTYKYMKPLARVPFEMDDELVDEYQHPIIDAYETFLHPHDSIDTDDECNIVSQFQILDATGIATPYNGIWDAWALQQGIVGWNKTIVIDAGLFELTDQDDAVKSLDHHLRKRKRGEFVAPGLMPLDELRQVGVNPSTMPSYHFSTNTAQYALREGQEIAFFWAVATFQPKKSYRQTLFAPTLLIRQEQLCDVFKHPYFSNSPGMIAEDLTLIFKVLAGEIKLKHKEDNGTFDLDWARRYFAPTQPANDEAFLDFLSTIEKAKDALDDDAEQKACITSVLLFLETAFPEKDYDEDEEEDENDFPLVVRNQVF